MCVWWIMSLTGHPCCMLPHDAAAKVLNQTGSYIQQESCCHCCLCCRCFSLRGTSQRVKLNGVFVLCSDLNSMGLTPSSRCLPIREPSIRWSEKMVKGGKTQCKVELISKCAVIVTDLILPPSWKALKINSHWPKNILLVISHITWCSPAEVHKPLNYIPNIPTAGLLLVNVFCEWNISEELSLRQAGTK